MSWSCTAPPSSSASNATGGHVGSSDRRMTRRMMSRGLNPMERMWSKIKMYLRKAKACTTETLIIAIREALETITATDALNWFLHCGYGVAHSSQPYPNFRGGQLFAS